MYACCTHVYAMYMYVCTMCVPSVCIYVCVPSNVQSITFALVYVLVSMFLCLITYEICIPYCLILIAQLSEYTQRKSTCTCHFSIPFVCSVTEVIVRDTTRIIKDLTEQRSFCTRYTFLLKLYTF